MIMYVKENSAKLEKKFLFLTFGFMEKLFFKTECI